MDVDNGLMNINGQWLEVECLTPEKCDFDLNPLLFLHEGLGSVAMWQTRQGNWPAQLCNATRRKGVVYSRQGYGQSQPIADVRGSGKLKSNYMQLHAWEVLPVLIEALGMKQPVLIGHSDGATIALLFAAKFRVEACVVMAPHVKVEAVSIHSIEAAKHAFLNGDLRKKLERFHADVDCAFWQWCDIWLSDDFRSFDIREICKNIIDPVLAIQGTDDAYGSLEQIEEIRPTHATIERCILQQCGHSPHRDQAETVTARIREFLSHSRAN